MGIGIGRNILVRIEDSIKFRGIYSAYALFEEM